MRDGIEDVTAVTPVCEVFGAADAELASVGGLAGGEDVVGLAFAGDGGIVCSGDVTFESVGVRLFCLRCDCEG